MSVYARVHIWMSKDGPNYLFGNGHAAVKVKDVNRDGCYITWLPSKKGSEASMQVGFAQLKDRKNGELKDNPSRYGSGNEVNFKREKQTYTVLPRGKKMEDLTEEEQKKLGLPDFTFDLPVLDVEHGAEGNLFGVSVRRMKTFWRDRLNEKPGHSSRRYRMLSVHNNCCGVVADALLAGGLGLYLSPPNNVVFQDARTLMRWVEKAKQKIEGMNKERRDILRLIFQNKVELDPNEHGIPTPEKWKKDSNQGIFALARRRDQIKQIDEYLPLYHRAARERNKGMQLKVLFMIQYEIYSHLTTKPKSDRRRAVLNLARTVEHVLEDLMNKREQVQEEDTESDFDLNDEKTW